MSVKFRFVIELKNNQRIDSSIATLVGMTILGGYWAGDEERALRARSSSPQFPQIVLSFRLTSLRKRSDRLEGRNLFFFFIQTIKTKT